MQNKYDEDTIQKALELSKAGLSSREIADLLDIRSKSTINNWRIKHDVSKPEPQVKKPKILVFDLETSPELSYHFGRYDVTINDTFNIKPSYLLSFSAKWLGKDEIVTIGLPYYEDYDPENIDDYNLCLDLHKLLDEADILVAHNLKGFDFKVAQTRFLLNGLPQISPTKLVDTLQIARSNFKFPTNKLDTLARQLGVGQKLAHTGANLWLGCLNGDEDSWDMMLEYNTVDVEVLEQVYLKLRPYHKSHPNLALYYEDNSHRCVVCGSDRLVLTDKKSFTGTGEFAVYECTNCGKHNRTKVNNLDKQKRSSLLVGSV